MYPCFIDTYPPASRTDFLIDPLYISYHQNSSHALDVLIALRSDQADGASYEMATMWVLLAQTRCYGSRDQQHKDATSGWMSYIIIQAQCSRHSCLVTATLELLLLSSEQILSRTLPWTVLSGRASLLRTLNRGS